MTVNKKMKKRATWFGLVTRMEERAMHCHIYKGLGMHEDSQKKDRQR